MAKGTEYKQNYHQGYDLYHLTANGDPVNDCGRGCCNVKGDSTGKEEGFPRWKGLPGKIVMVKCGASCWQIMFSLWCCLWAMLAIILIAIKIEVLWRTWCCWQPDQKQTRWSRILEAQGRLMLLGEALASYFPHPQPVLMIQWWNWYWC